MQTGAVVDTQARIPWNDYSVVQPPVVGAWAPTRTVSVVIPAWNGQDKLNLTLASLAAQSYPAHLLEVVVVDDGSHPALRLPEIRPERTRLVPAPADGWGIARAGNLGAELADGDVMHRVDSDMVLFADHIEAQMRWHHAADYLVLLGYKRFVPFTEGQLSPERVYEAVRSGQADSLFGDVRGEPHEWVEKLIDETDGLRAAGTEAFRAVVGATVSLPRQLFRAIGGMDESLARGEDSELGYRLSQAGAVFVPEPLSRSWHLGASAMMTDGRRVVRYTRPFVTDRMAQPHRRRSGPGRQWSVPFVEVVVEAEYGTYEQIAAICDRVLAGTLSDIRVTLVGPWDRTAARREGLADDPYAELRMLRARYRGDGRVRFVTSVTTSAAPIPFRLSLYPGWAPHPDAVQLLVSRADKELLGAVEVAGPDGRTARLERTSAVGRAGLLRGETKPVADLVDELFGSTTVSTEQVLFHPVGPDGEVIRAEGEPPVPMDRAGLLRARIAELSRERAEFRERARAAEKRLASRDEDLARVKERLTAVEKERTQLRRQVRDLRKEVEFLRTPWVRRTARRVVRRLRRYRVTRNR